jgi:hypothetical protein
MYQKNFFETRPKTTPKFFTMAEKRHYVIWLFCLISLLLYCISLGQGNWSTSKATTGGMTADGESGAFDGRRV